MFALLISRQLRPATGGQWYEFFPSIIWIILMVAPLMFQAGQLYQKTLGIQVLGVTIFSFFILLGDIISNQHIGFKERITKTTNFHKYIAYALIIISLTMQFIHYSLMPDIPLILYLRDLGASLQSFISNGEWNFTDRHTYYISLREASSKNLQVSALFLYVCQASRYIFIPLATLLLLQYKKYLMISILILATLFYSRSTLAKGPLYIVGTLLFIQFLLYFKPYKKKIFLYPTLAIISISFLFLLGYFGLNKDSLFNKKASKHEIARVYKELSQYPDNKLFFTLADHYRVSHAPSNFFKKQLSYFAYRIFLVPSEVSHYWYLYFSEIKKEYVGLYGLTSSSRQSKNYVHLANEVGKWAYLRKFPEWYSKTIRAYCSADADAFARGGFLWIILVGFLLSLFRISLSLFKGSVLTTRIFYTTSLFLLSVNLPVSSLQAILIAQGVGLCLPLLVLLHICGVRQNEQIRAES